LVQSEEGKARGAHLWSLIAELKAALTARGWALPEAGSAIVPLIIGEEGAAMATAAAMREAGVFVPAVRYPTVARGEARLRVTVTSGHTSADVAELLKVLPKCHGDLE